MPVTNATKAGNAARAGNAGTATKVGNATRPANATKAANAGTAGNATNAATTPTATTAARRARDPEATRGKILMAAFGEIHRRGFQAASLDRILAEAGVTKGALYHHFPDKASLGYAVVDDVVRGFLLDRWLGPLDRATGDPLKAMQRTLLLRGTSIQLHEVEFGCPLNNLAQEMSPLDEEFRKRIDAIFDEWRGGFARAIERARSAGTVRKDVDARQVATFLVAAVEGSFGLAKGARSRKMFHSNMEMLVDYLDTLRPAAKRQGNGAERRVRD